MSLKKIALTAARCGGALAVCRVLTRNHVRILAYHGVDELSDAVVNYDGFQIPPDVFRSQLVVLRRHFQVCSLGEVIRSLREGRALPPRPVVITFDDGYRNNLTVAAPLLQEFGFPAAFFITTGFVDGSHQPWWYIWRSAVARTTVESVSLPTGEQASLVSEENRIRAARRGEQVLKDLREAERARKLQELLVELKVNRSVPDYPLLDWNGVRKLMESDFEVGAHGAAHISLGLENPNVAMEDARQSIRRLTEQTGRTQAHFAYPYGRNQDRRNEVEELLKAEGLVSALTTCPGLNRPGANPFGLKRLNITGHHTPAAFESLVSGFTRAIKPGQL